jgi:hypothetical protein
LLITLSERPSFADVTGWAHDMTRRAAPI